MIVNEHTNGPHGIPVFQKDIGKSGPQEFHNSSIEHQALGPLGVNFVGHWCILDFPKKRILDLLFRWYYRGLHRNYNVTVAAWCATVTMRQVVA